MVSKFMGGDRMFLGRLWGLCRIFLDNIHVYLGLVRNRNKKLDLT